MRNKKLFTIGYENLNFDQFENKLKKASIKILVDVRDYPKSRKKGYSKSELEKKFSNNGIKYIHIKELGSPSDLRKKVRKDRKYEYFFRKYKEYLTHHEDSLSELADLIRSKKTCIFCYEEDYNFCHRKSIAAYLNAFSDGEFDIKHI